MASQAAPMEEIIWRSPQHVQMMGGYLHSNNSVSAALGPRIALW